jgi:hypothetical protein
VPVTERPSTVTSAVRTGRCGSAARYDVQLGTAAGVALRVVVGVAVGTGRLAVALGDAGELGGEVADGEDVGVGLAVGATAVLPPDVHAPTRSSRARARRTSRR